MNMSDTKPISETDRLLRDLDKPSLGNLAYALRHPETWPKGFVWDYRECDQCAMGLAHQLWKGIIPRVDRSDGASIMANRFAIPYSAARDIFVGDGWTSSYTKNSFFGLVKTPIRYGSVTPEMVADAIDAHIARAD